uniref:Resolvase HTH domain-containing protein n=1 Tax=Anaerobacillus isosaccharinicus TaxID=1532552 RepID=A0A1S2LI09_9BACI
MEKWLKYVEIKRMLEQGYSKAKVAEKFNISRGTLYKYLNMTPDEMSTWLASSKTRRKKLDVFNGGGL